MRFFGINYGISPALSLGSPCIIIDDYYLGVGHIKIHSNIDKYPYLKNSNIENFRNNLYLDYKRLFGDNYIRHMGTGFPPDCYGYIYMLYFYTIEFPMGQDEAVMHISDAYLPLNRNDNNLYKFSLFFPMGICNDGNNLLVSCGEGDFYSVICKFNLNDIYKLCKYNIKDMDFNNYNYYIIENMPDRFNLKTRLII
jgi:hypothetical protein